MATIDLAGSVLPAQQSAQEVIDVDSFDDDEILLVEPSFPSINSRGSRTHPAGPRVASGTTSASAIVVESDDEDAARVRSAHAQRRFISPPPRPIHPRYAPPVPPIPPHLAGNRAFPVHLGRRGDAVPPVRPNARPFAFEASIRQTPPLRRHTPMLDVLPPAPAARSHHQPAMGLGGALIALNRQNIVEEVNRQREAEEQLRSQRRLPERGWRHYLPDFLDFWREDSQPAPQRGLPGEAEIYHGTILFNEPIGDLEDLRLLRVIMDNQFGDGGRRGPIPTFERSREQHYKPSYTHPEKPMPGFTFDFAPPEVPSTTETTSPIIFLDDDEETTAGPSKPSGGAIEAPATLVCARCNDPLTLSAESAAPEEELARQKIWGLRCGHMLDGKCIQELMKPAPSPPSPALADALEVHDSKGKGKARDVLHADIVTDISKPESGKGKRIAGKEPAPRRSKRKAAEMLHSDADTSLAGGPAADSAQVPPEDNSIRSRLRSRRPRPPSIISTLEAEPMALPPSPPRPVHPLPRRRGHGSASTRRKGKGKAKSVVEAVHEWACPVAGCGYVHASIRVDGEWKMDPERGAIGLFI
ncbi:hypothetical protein DAEQUDRAFT_511050 [Daedalea quercina L-15889]|uniref:Uncharacterized protein n=1 Tax=Daedalea quercina L-15889 TaxID=1314783 RepID=A0A165TB93_9APHY|nr:hypothetical protein DAEQUDRAFT_511050 [Daedalea quercina L-15889]